jgi:hypothetical protein
MAEKKSKLAEIKTKPTAASVEDFINNIKDEQKRKDSFVLLEMMKKATGKNRFYGAALSLVLVIKDTKAPPQAGKLIGFG